MTPFGQVRDPRAPLPIVRSVPDVERLRRLADEAVAVHDAVMRRTMLREVPCAPA